MPVDQLDVLIVDDEAANLESLKKIFEREAARVDTASSGQKALEKCERQRFDVILTDLMMPGMNGIELVQALKTRNAQAEIVLMTAFGTIEKAVEAMRAGAYDFVEKPLKRVHIVKTVMQAAERKRLLAENTLLKKKISALESTPIIGSSAALQRALQIATQAAPSAATVLILGESGTGKELLARYIHERSGRDPFVSVNISALPETIIESELFGHERGAFTGATHKREGRIAQADGGTLFLDEIGELSPAIQVKLLRVLQQGEYQPLGGGTKHANFRLIAATNRNLEAAVENNEFREDLYYRLNVISVTSPPLRDRPEDVPILVEHFVDSYCRKNNRPLLRLERDVLDRLSHYSWPGNVRELQNVIERAVVLAKGNVLTLADLPPNIASAQQRRDEFRFAIGTPLAQIEQEIIEGTLRHTEGDKQRAAQLLGISPRTIYRKLDPEKAG